MATVGALNIDLTAQTAAFMADLGKASRVLSTNVGQMNKSLQTLETGFLGVQKSVGKAMAAFGVGFGVSQLAGFLKSTLDTVGGLGELAEQLGVSTDALQIYQFAAAQAGIKQGELEAGLGRLTRSIGDAAGGDKALIEAFNRIGVGVLDANGKVRSTEDVLTDFAEALKKIDDPARRAAAAAELMGRGGQKLLPLLSQGAAGLEEFGKQAKGANAVLDKELIARFDEASDKLARWGMQLTIFTAMNLDKFGSAASKTGDDLAELGDQLSGAQLSRELGALTRALLGMDAFKSTTDDINTWGKALADAGVDVDLLLDRMSGAKLSRGIGSWVRGLVGMQPMELPAAPEAGGGLMPPGRKPTAPGGTHNPVVVDKQAETAKLRIDELIRSMEAEEAQIGMTARAKDIAVKVEQAEAIARSANIKVMDAQREAIERLAGSVSDGVEASKRNEEALESALAGMKVYTDTQDEIANNALLIDALKRGNEEYEKQAANIEILNRYKSSGIKVDAQVVANAKEQADALGAQRDEIDKIKDAQRDWAETSRDATRVIGTAFEDAAIKMESGRDVAVAALEDMQRILWRMAVTKPLDNMAQSAFASGGPMDGIMAGIGSFFSGMAFADGGRPPVGKASLVGENGPEYFVPDSAGTIIPNGGSMGGGPTYYIDARGADKEGLARLENYIRSVDGSVERRAVSAVTSARGRNPALFSA